MRRPFDVCGMMYMRLSSSRCHFRRLEVLHWNNANLR
jgi:hypothetical protein